MKKTLLALAVLGTFAGAASAQSSVTMYGRVDLAMGKPIGVAQKGMWNGSGSRLGMRGVEDMGGGLKAIFNIEHRFNADTGVSGEGNSIASAPATRFWGGRSIVGLEGSFGRVTFGREYAPAFLISQLAADPWGWDTVVAGQGGGGAIGAAITGGGIARVRNDSAITYTMSSGGLTFGVQTAERTDVINNFTKRPINFGLGYSGGPFKFNVGYEVTGQPNAKWMSLGASYALGAWTPGVFIGSGTSTANNKHKSVMLTSTFGLGAGEVRLAVGNLKAKTPAGVSTDVVKSGIALGYHHSLSKRTTMYFDLGRNGALASEKIGYDVGLKHNF